MWVCHCAAVNERQVRRAVEQGACDERDVASICGAGAGCGACQDEVRRILSESTHAFAG